MGEGRGEGSFRFCVGPSRSRLSMSPPCECPRLPKLRTDLIISRQGEAHATIWVVKDPVQGGFFRFQEIEGFILDRLDGTLSLQPLREQVEARFAASLPFPTLEQFVQKLQRLHLLA